MSTKQEIQRELVRNGYVVSIDKWPRKVTYYKPDGEALPNGPADPFSMQRYLRRGLTLTPPVEKPVGVVEKVEKPFKCHFPEKAFKCHFPRCRFGSHSARGLKIHQSKHGREQKKTVLGTE